LLIQIIYKVAPLLRIQDSDSLHQLFEVHMLREVTGDILLSDAQAIAHGVAPNDDFKQGLALSLREQWPSMYKDFRHFCQSTSPSAGELWSWKGAGGPVIVNLFTQDPPKHVGGHPGKATLEHVGHCLKALKKEAEKSGYKSVAITRLATGVGGLDWSDVKPLVEKTFADSKLNVLVYSKFAHGVKAKES
jgi:O-acetyl-ADP-ribose deacetylase (regulator of RNase III)